MIDSDVLSLVDEVDKRRRAAGEAPVIDPAAAADADEPRIKNEKDLQEYETIFADVDYNAQTLIEAVQIFHIIGHLDSIKATLGRAEATSSLSFMQPHAV